MFMEMWSRELPLLKKSTLLNIVDSIYFLGFGFDKINWQI